jgi:hypothetical protein
LKYFQQKKIHDKRNSALPGVQSGAGSYKLNNLKQLPTYLFLICSILGQAQPGSLSLDSLLRFVDWHETHRSGYALAPGENSIVTKKAEVILGQLDSFYYYRVENGKRLYWTHKTIIEADTIFHFFFEMDKPDYGTQVYSKATGKLLKTLTQRGKTELEYHYSEDGKLDSTTSGLGGNMYVVYDGNKEYWRLTENNQLLTYQEFDEDGHIIQIRNHRGLAEDGSEWREINFEWKKGQLVKSHTRTVKKGESRPGVENTFERDKNGLLKSVGYYEFDSNKRKFKVIGFGGPVKYETSKNDKGHTIVTRPYQGETIVFTFDEWGNWLSIVGKYVEEHRVLFYKKQIISAISK